MTSGSCFWAHFFVNWLLFKPDRAKNLSKFLSDGIKFFKFWSCLPWVTTQLNFRSHIYLNLPQRLFITKGSAKSAQSATAFNIVDIFWYEKLLKKREPDYCEHKNDMYSYSTINNCWWNIINFEKKIKIRYLCHSCKNNCRNDQYQYNSHTKQLFPVYLILESFIVFF